jgi:predicted DNA-binding protein
MYEYIMRRTQIYLSEEESEAVEAAARSAGRTRSKIIRDAIDEKYLRRPATNELLQAIDAAFGAWRRREEDGEAYVERLRRGRLARLHRKRR